MIQVYGIAKECGASAHKLVSRDFSSDVDKAALFGIKYTQNNCALCHSPTRNKKDRTDRGVVSTALVSAVSNITIIYVHFVLYMILNASIHCISSRPSFSHQQQSSSVRKDFGSSLLLSLVKFTCFWYPFGIRTMTIDTL